MKITFKNITLLFVAMTFAQQLTAQTDLQLKFNDYNIRGLQEKIFIHTDRNFYFTGETIYVSAYEIDGVTHQPLDLSKVLYIEIIDKDLSPVVQVKISLLSGRGSGSIVLPALNSGTYVMRAYTRWMKNFAPEFFFSKRLSIVNTGQGPSNKESVYSDSISVRFFPEGGNLVEGLTSKVGFQITDSKGNGIDVSGTIVDESGSPVVTFQPLKFGIGNFLFTPGDHRYTATVNYRGSTTTHHIPSIQKQGYVMTLNDLNADKLQVVVSEQKSLTSRDTLLLLIHTRHQIKVVLATSFNESKAGFLIDKNKLGDGISHITIFNSRRQPLCERLYFQRPKNKLLIQAKTDRGFYSPRQKVDLTLSTKDVSSKGVAALLSLSVFRIDSLQSTNEPQIVSSILLAADLKGSIESPEYYLSEPNATVLAATDNLMLTHGWRRFDWKNILAGNYPTINFSPEFEGAIISGKILNRKLQKPAANLALFLSVPGTKPQLYTAKSNTVGKFEFYVPKPIGRNEMVIQPERDAATYVITTDNPFSESPVSNFAGDLVVSKDLVNTTLTSSIHAQAEKYFRKQKATGELKRDSLPFYGKADEHYVLDDYERFPTVEEIFREYVPDVTVMKNEFFVRNRVEQSYFVNKPLVMLDGLPVFDHGRILAMNPQHIRSLDVIAKRYWLGPVVLNGIVNFTTYKNDLTGVDLDPEIFVLDFEGLEQQREFYSPEYETLEQVKSRTPDFRSLLQWSPDIATDKAGNHQIHFYTSDKKGQFIGILNGITKEGLLGTTVFTFSVDDK